MITIISCTNRIPSRSIKVAQYYQNLLHKLGAQSQILDLSQLPPEFLFTALYDNTGKDPAFNKLTDLIKDSDKIVFIVPEYNGSFPGVLKAFIDGLAYPASFKNKKGALVGISSGAMGGSLALSHLTDILNYLGMHVLAIKPRLPRVEGILKDGEIKDEFLKELLETQAREFLQF
ncbi:MAG TPA: NAD(P)H-dependent oxidoreductase [Cytophagaceae bacterium]